MTKSSRKLEKTKKCLRKFYRKHNIAVPEDVDSVLRAVNRAVKKRGQSFYREHRDRCGRFVERMLEKYEVGETKSGAFWRYACICRMIGPAPRQTQPVYNHKEAKKSSPKRGCSTSKQSSLPLRPAKKLWKTSRKRWRKR